MIAVPKISLILGIFLFNTFVSKDKFPCGGNVAELSQWLWVGASEKPSLLEKGGPKRRERIVNDKLCCWAR